MSFPASNILLSDAMHKDHQGLAASLVNTVINYSISIGLGIAGTVEVYVNHGGKDVLRGYRGAQYTGVGLAGLGLASSILFALSERAHRAKERKETREDAV
jgi:predicted MFS family arabinose efflux permease